MTLLEHFLRSGSYAQVKSYGLGPSPTAGDASKNSNFISDVMIDGKAEGKFQGYKNRIRQKTLSILIYNSNAMFECNINRLMMK